MSFSTLYSAIIRGTWFIDYRIVDSQQVIIDSLLKREINSEEQIKLSDKNAILVKMSTGKEMSIGNNFADAPQGSVAIIPLRGSMLKYGTYCSYGTTEIAELIDEAADSPKINGIILDIDSGGGSVDAISPIVQSIQRAQGNGKPVVACCDLCASAAYYVACFCDEIIASNSISSEFGSIGVMLSFMDYAKYYEKEGVKQHTIYSDLSSYKNEPFEAAKQGNYEKIKNEELNPLAREFQETVKRQRGDKLDTKVEGIIAGRMFYAKQAKENGLIDGIGTIELAVKRVKEIRSDAEIDNYIKSKI